MKWTESGGKTAEVARNSASGGDGSWVLTVPKFDPRFHSLINSSFSTLLAYQIRTSVRSYSRHQLKQDSFRTSTTETISWAVEHQSKLTAAVVAVVVLLAVVIGGWAYVNYRDQQGRSELAGAIQKYDAPIRPAGTPATPDMLSFGSIQERAKAANTDFIRIAGKYSFTQSGRVARYFAGVTLHDMGDNAGAEKDLKEVADSRYKEIASLAKLALASIYHDTNRDP